jgi:hypothetical protein
MFTTSYYFSRDSKLRRILKDAQKAKSLRDIDVDGFNEIKESLDLDVEVVHAIESIIDYFDLFFTLSNYVYNIGDLSLEHFKLDVVNVNKYRSVNELLMEVYGFPSVKQVVDSNYNMPLVEFSRKLLIDIIKKKHPNLSNGIYKEKIDLDDTQDDIEIDAENMVGENSVTFDGEHEWTFEEIETKINRITESYNRALLVN